MIKIELIKDYIQENKLSKAKFCKICKISPITLKKKLNNENVSLNAVYKISKILGIYLHQIFNS